jgi:hypothetical protein
VFAAVRELDVDVFLVDRKRHRLPDGDLAFEVRCGDRHHRLELQPQIGGLDDVGPDLGRAMPRRDDAGTHRTPGVAGRAADGVVVLASSVDERPRLPLALRSGTDGHQAHCRHEQHPPRHADNYARLWEQTLASRRMLV